jgi:hypothetical protein
VSRKLSPVGFECHLEDKTLVNVRKEKDLGVLITSHLTWDQQVLAVVCQANKMLGLLRRTRLLIDDTRLSDHSIFHWLNAT